LYRYRIFCWLLPFCPGRFLGKRKCGWTASLSTTELCGTAEKFFNSAFQQAKDFGERDPRLATSLNNLASLEHVRRKDANAESLYRRSLNLSEKIYGPDHTQLAGVLNNLANLLQEQARYPEAEILLQRALDIREKALDLSTRTLLSFSAASVCFVARKAVLGSRTTSPACAGDPPKNSRSRTTGGGGGPQ